MITVTELRKQLAQFPDDAMVARWRAVHEQHAIYHYFDDKPVFTLRHMYKVITKSYCEGQPDNINYVDISDSPSKRTVSITDIDVVMIT